MTSEQNRVRQEFRDLGFILPEWILCQKPELIHEGGYSYIIVEGGVTFDAEQFKVDNVLQRYALIQKFSN